MVQGELLFVTPEKSTSQAPEHAGSQKVCQCCTTRQKKSLSPSYKNKFIFILDISDPFCNSIRTRQHHTILITPTEKHHDFHSRQRCGTLHSTRNRNFFQNRKIHKRLEGANKKRRLSIMLDRPLFCSSLGWNKNLERRKSRL